MIKTFLIRLAVAVSCALILLSWAELLRSATPCHVRIVNGWEEQDPAENCTPGDTRTIDAALVCTQKTGPFRTATQKDKVDACIAYGLMKGCPGAAYRLDDLRSLTIGGANTRLNFWPQDTKQSRIKDKLENYLHRLVCPKKGQNPQLTPEQAQSCIMDWVHCAQKYKMLPASVPMSKGDVLTGGDRNMQLPRFKKLTTADLPPLGASPSGLKAAVH